MNKRLTCRIVTARRCMSVNSCYVHEMWESERFQTIKVTCNVIQGYWQRCHSIAHIRFPVNVTL